MQVTVFGANGKVGQLVVRELLDDGHRVRAFVHSNSKFKARSSLHVIDGDIRDPAAVAAAIDGADAVISTLGSWGTETKDVLSAGMRVIIPAMESLRVSRIISLTGAGARAAGDKPRLIDRLSCLGIRLFAPKIVRDGERHIELLSKSKLQWTVVRSPVMREHSRARGFSFNRVMPSPWATIVRQDVARAIVELASNKEWRRSSPYLRHK